MPRSATLGELGELVKREFGVDPEAFVAAATAARFGPPEGAAAAAVDGDGASCGPCSRSRAAVSPGGSGCAASSRSARSRVSAAGTAS